MHKEKSNLLNSGKKSNYNSVTLVLIPVNSLGAWDTP
jgi:hypothetical protein